VSRVHVVVPDSIDDPERPSGGNAYDRHLCRELRARGWEVREHPAAGSWPLPDAGAHRSLAGQLAAVPDGEVLLVDGLIASAAQAVLLPATQRLTLVVLLHLPLGETSQDPGVSSGECAVLSAARAVVTTSSWTRDWLLRRYPLLPERLVVAAPGTESAGLAVGTADGRELLCVGAVVPQKGQDVLVGALAGISDLPWRCVCVGPLDRDSTFVRRVHQQAIEAGIGDRVHFSGARTGQDLDRRYAAADLLVHPSRRETYGMVITEALARGLPVVATQVGGVPEALGSVSGDGRPGLLVRPGDADALRATLRSWLLDATVRDRLRAGARERRGSLAGWGVTADRIARVLTEVAA
jgi:glycosyltransferase involved in cell wall biosynthesis